MCATTIHFFYSSNNNIEPIWSVHNDKCLTLVCICGSRDIAFIRQALLLYFSWSRVRLFGSMFGWRSSYDSLDISNILYITRSRNLNNKAVWYAWLIESIGRALKHSIRYRIKLHAVHVNNTYEPRQIPRYTMFLFWMWRRGSDSELFIVESLHTRWRDGCFFFVKSVLTHSLHIRRDIDSYLDL